MQITYKINSLDKRFNFQKDSRRLQVDAKYIHIFRPIKVTRKEVFSKLILCKEQTKNDF